MKVVRQLDFLFNVDYDFNAEYYRGKSEDKAPYVRNFANRMRFFSPELNTFLDDFAVDIVKPEKLEWVDDGDLVIYRAAYRVKGSLVSADSYSRTISRMLIEAKPLDSEYFIIEVSGIKLTWVLLDPRYPEKAAAPEKKGFLKKLLKK